MGRYKKADLSKIKTISLAERKSKAEITLLGKPFEGGDAAKFLESLPQFLKANDFRELLDRIVTARKNDFPFHLMMGAHSIKVGLSPIYIDLMKRGIVTGISLNSAGLIHDLELSFAGKTSEDVAEGLKDGSFGMSEQTGKMFADVVNLAESRKIGLGEAAGIYINEQKAKYRENSLFAAADSFNLPATIHLAVGTDIVCQQENYDASAAAEASFIDFRILAEILTRADLGGVVINVGSAVVLPEVFLKALTVARNLVKQDCNITTANFDMINHYRPMMNVVKRPTEKGGKGFNLTGHHELMIPLLAWTLKSFFDDNS